jgi:hypothetical protein
MEFEEYKASKKSLQEVPEMFYEGKIDKDAALKLLKYRYENIMQELEKHSEGGIQYV